MFSNCTFFDNSKDIITLTTPEGKIEYLSPSHELILGYIDESTIYDHIHPDDLGLIERAYDYMLRTEESCEIEIRKKNIKGEWVWLGASFSPVLSVGIIKHIIVISREISEYKQYQFELERMAYYDFLTGLYNRRKVKSLMDDMLSKAHSKGLKIAVLIMDLDNFKLINDTYGHEVGDIVLKDFANRLLQSKSEIAIVGRLSGDEFIVLMELDNGITDIQSFIERFHDALIPPCSISDEVNIAIKTSVGFSIYPDHGYTARMLLKHADNELYNDKKNKVSRYR